MSMGQMAWEPERFTPTRKRWWSVVLESDWVTDGEIINALGPEYLMYEDMEQFGSEAAYRGFPKAKR